MSWPLAFAIIGVTWALVPIVFILRTSHERDYAWYKVDARLKKLEEAAGGQNANS